MRVSGVKYGYLIRQVIISVTGVARQVMSRRWPDTFCRPSITLPQSLSSSCRSRSEMRCDGTAAPSLFAWTLVFQSSQFIIFAPR